MKKLKVVGFVCLLMMMAGPYAWSASEERPNLLVMVVDDQRWDEFSATGHNFLETPNIDRLANEGAMFSSAYAVSPLCSPNRASILTGQSISRHGIVDNISRDASSHRLNLFAEDLQKVGYKTAHVGKWHMGNDPTPRPGYDYWVSYAGQGRSINPILFEDGELQTIDGYMSDVLTDRAISFIEKQDEKPFFLYLAHKSVHPEVKQLDDSSIDLSYPQKYVAAPRHQGKYKDEFYQRRKNTKLSKEQYDAKPMLKQILEAKSQYINDDLWRPKLDWGTAESTIRDRSEMILAIDDGLGRIMKTLEERGILDNTVILLTSDNGYFYGEQNGLSIERRMPYEEGIRLPFLMRYPKLIKAGFKSDKFVLSTDIAPTMLDLGGAKISSKIQGRSLLPLFENAVAEWRDSFLVEYSSYEKPMPWMIDTSYKVIRKNNYKYIHWISAPENNELYDLANDPYEMNNIVYQEKHKELIRKLQAELASLVAQAVGVGS